MAKVVGPQLYCNLPMKKRWLLLVEPPDYVAADIAVNGVRLEFLTAPPLKSSKHPPAHLSYHSVESIQILNPFILDWLERDIITTQNIPTRVFWSRWEKETCPRPISTMFVHGLQG